MSFSTIRKMFMTSEKHKTQVKSRHQTPAISSVSAPASGPSTVSNVTLASVPAAAAPATTLGIIDLRTMFGSTSTLKAEVLRMLNTVAKHQSYNSNDGIGKLFKCMFSDSDVAKTFDKIAAALKDPLVLAKLTFYRALARTFNPYLKKYQTDKPVMPFLCQDLAELIMVGFMGVALHIIITILLSPLIRPKWFVHCVDNMGFMISNV